MSYPPERNSSKNRFLGEGFRLEPDFRVEPDYRTESGASVYDASTVPVAGTDVGAAESATGDIGEDRPGLPPRAPLALPATPDVPFAPTPVELNNAFDDPQHGEPGRDRFGVHAIIEIVLLLAAAGLVVAVNQKSHLDSFGIRNLLALVTVYGLLGVGAGLSLRAGAVNLAIGPIMVASALYFGQQRAHHNWYVAGGLALAIAAGIGAVIALIVAILQVPGWAVSLAAFVGVSVWISHLPADVRLVDVPDPVTHAYEIFGAFAIVAVVGAMIGAIRAVRRGVGRFRPVSDPADRRGAGAAWTVGIAMVVSSVLAALAGILYSMTTGGAVTDTGITWTAVAVAIALAGGTSAYGRRGGIFGTVLAAIVFVLVGRYSDLANYRIDPRVLIGSALVIGLLATRLVETYGRPHRAYDEATSRWLGGSASQWPGDDETSRTVATPAAEPERPHADWVDSGGDPWPGR